MPKGVPWGGRLTLRGRLTIAFLAVVLGPVLLGAFFVGAAAGATSGERSAERLDRAVTAVATSVGALCRQLHAGAAAVALLGPPDRRAAVAQRLVASGLGTGVDVTDAGGGPVFRTAGLPAQPWADCAGPAVVAPYTAMLARVDMRDPGGAPLGAVRVVQVLDQVLVERLAAASGAEVTLTGGGTAARSTEAAADRSAVIEVAGAPGTSALRQTPDGRRYVRRAGPTPEQPLPLVLSVPRGSPQGLYALLAGAVVLAGLLAVAAAWWLARSTTRPLAELAHAAGRVAGGDLAARVPVRAHDEVGRLAGTFNRMTREMQSYVVALTASRDQLRGHLAILGDTLSSTHDLGRILQVILQTALAATGARAGAVLLLDAGTGVLVGQCAEGLEERWPRPAGGGNGTPAGDPPPERDPGSLRVPLGCGLLGSVAVTGVPLRGRLDRDGPALSPNEPRCRTYVAVPFAVPDPAAAATRPPGGAATRPPGGAAPLPPPGPASSRGDPGRSWWPPGLPAALGVLALYDRLGSDEFDDADLSTLRTFAGQAAVAVDNVRVHEEAQRLSLTDPLTGLWNYRYLRESVRREVERASRFGRMLTVLILDLDHFKRVNDTYGHGAGDAVLAEFATRIRGEVREVDLVFRQGGEEFVILLPETDAAGGTVLAERLGSVIRDRPVAIHSTHPDGRTGAERVGISVSIGIAVYPTHATTAAQMLDAADEALYAAKAGGRDTYRVAPDMRPPAHQEIAVRTSPASPDDGLPRAGAGAVPDGDTAVTPPAPRGAGLTGAPSGPHQARPGNGR